MKNEVIRENAASLNNFKSPGTPYFRVPQELKMKFRIADINPENSIDASKGNMSIVQTWA